MLLAFLNRSLDRHFGQGQTPEIGTIRHTAVPEENLAEAAFCVLCITWKDYSEEMAPKFVASSRKNDKHTFLDRSVDPLSFHCYLSSFYCNSRGCKR